MVISMLLAGAAACVALASLHGYIAVAVRRDLRHRLQEMAGTVPAYGPGWVQRFLRAVDSSSWGRATAKLLVRADWKIRPVCYGGLLAAAVAALCGLLFLGGLGLPPALVISIAVTRRGAAWLLSTRSGRLVAGVERQLPKIVRLLSNALRAGLSMHQGFRLAAHDLAPHAVHCFERLNHELAFGVPLERSLGNLLDRIPSKELRLVVDLILIQRQVGGDLAGALEEMTTTLIERHNLNSEAKSATAEQRYVAGSLPLMIIAAGLLMSAAIPGFLRPLTSVPGLLLIGVVTLLVAGAHLWIIRLAAVRW